MRKALLVLTAVAALLPACGGDDDGGTTAATGDTAETGKFAMTTTVVPTPTARRGRIRRRRSGCR